MHPRGLVYVVLLVILMMMIAILEDTYRLLDEKSQVQNKAAVLSTWAAIFVPASSFYVRPVK